MDNKILWVSENNHIAYEYLFKIENGLREFIIKILSEKHGPFWYKTYLPGEVYKTYKDGRQFERTIPWVKLVPHHPIYYTDFPDLRQIIERKDNWEQCFKKFFKNKQIISSSLSEIEFIRNKVAHNRLIVEKDCEILNSSFTKISNMIGQIEFENYYKTITKNESILMSINLLKEDIISNFELVISFSIINLNNWGNLQDQWWFDEDYLGSNLNPIKEFYLLLQEYNSLPRRRGEGYKIEQWVKQHINQEIIIKAIHIIDKLCEEN